MNVVIMIAAFFSGLAMCLWLVLMKWIITQLGATICFLVLFLTIAVFLLTMGDDKYEDSDE